MITLRGSFMCMQTPTYARRRSSITDRRTRLCRSAAWRYCSAPWLETRLPPCAGTRTDACCRWPSTASCCATPALCRSEVSRIVATQTSLQQRCQPLRFGRNYYAVWTFMDDDDDKVSYRKQVARQHSCYINFCPIRRPPGPVRVRPVKISSHPALSLRKF